MPPHPGAASSATPSATAQWSGLRTWVADLRRTLAADPGLLLLVLIVLTLPFELTKQLFPFQVIEVSRILIAVGYGVVLARVARGDIRAVPKALAMAVLLLIVASGLSLLATRWPNGIRLEAATIAYAGFALFIAQAVRSERALRIVLGALVVSGVIVAVILLGQTLGGFYLWFEHRQSVLGRRNGTFADPNITARFLAIAATSVLGLVAAERAAGRTSLLITAAAMAVIGSGAALTQSRAGWLVLAVALVLGLILVGRRLRTAAMIAAFAIGFAGTLFVNPQALIRAGGIAVDAGEIIDNLTGGLGGEPLAEIPDRSPPLAVDPVLNRIPLDGVRRYLARAGVAMFLDHPATGVGLGGFQPAILDEYEVFIPDDRRRSPVSLPHTEVIRIAAETGAVGLAVATAFFVVIFTVLFRTARRLAVLGPLLAAIGLGVLTILIASQFEGRLFDEPYLWLLIGLAAAGAMVRAAGDERERSPAR